MPADRSSYVAPECGASAPKSAYVPQSESPVKESSSESSRGSNVGQTPKSDYVRGRDDSPVKERVSFSPSASPRAKLSRGASAGVSSGYTQAREEHTATAKVSSGYVQEHTATSKGTGLSTCANFSRAANQRNGLFAYIGKVFDTAIGTAKGVLAAMLGSIILTKDAIVSAVCMYIGIHFWLLTAVLEKIQEGVKFAIHQSASSYELLKEKSAASYEKAKGVGVSSIGAFKEKSDVGYNQAKHVGQSGVQRIKETTSDGLDLLKGTAVRLRKSISDLAVETKLKSEHGISKAEKVL
jgi:hypothetical protein